MTQLGMRTQLAIMGNRWTLALVMLLLTVVIFAWYQGGEEPLRTIEQDVPMPGAGQ